MTAHKHHALYSVPLGCLVHLLGLCLSATGISYSLLYISEDGEGMFEYKGWPGKFKYLTFWCQLTLPLYFLVCVLNDLAGGVTTDRQQYLHRGRLQTFRDNFHATWAFPIGIFVVTSFWGIYSVDRELVFPKELDKIIPTWHNHNIFVATSFWVIYSIDSELLRSKVLDRMIPVWVKHIDFVATSFWVIYSIDPDLLLSKEMARMMPVWLNHIEFVVSSFWTIYTLDRELVFPKELDRIIPVWQNHIKFVVTTFWAIYAVDRELVYPRVLDKIIPMWANHLSHTSPLVLLLLEKMFVNITYPRWYRGLTATMCFTAVYLSWVLWIAHSQDIWAYPILKVLDTTWRSVFLAAMCAYIGLVYLLGLWLSDQLWWGPAHLAKPKKKVR